MKCKDCKHYVPDGGALNIYIGSCERWRYGYGETGTLKRNEVICEDDEGWGAVMGPDFGCVLFEPLTTMEQK